MDAVLDPAFQWDGSNSDLAQQFYRAHAAAPSAAQPSALSYSTEELPAPVQSRLAAAALRFEQLPPLLQRALLWDSGFVFGAGRGLLRVFTSENRTMAQLAVSLERFRRAGCSALNCTSQYRSQFCSGKQMLSVSHCVAEDVANSQIHSSMWSIGTGRSAQEESENATVVVPEMNLARHQWIDGNYSYLVYAIHTIAEEKEPAWSVCPAANSSQATGLAVPCGVYAAQGTRTAQWQPPPPTALVTTWLAVTKQQLHDSERLSTGALVAIICGSAVALLALLVAAWCFRKRRRERRAAAAAADATAVMLASDGQHQYMAKGAGHDASGDTFHSTVTPTTQPRQPHPQQHTRRSAQFDDDTMNATLKTLVADPNLAGKLLALDEIQLQRQVASGAFGEVWLATYAGTQVAAKRLRKDRRPKFQDLEDFTAEIRLTASLRHPHLVQFVGVAWLSLDSLCMVTEYMANGDLQGYLNTHMDTLAGFWTSEKTAIALGVARALAYLHSLAPPLIHRDVKAKNVLLDEELQPRLMDFGVSRQRRVDLTMTAGIGTPFWTAPEIVEGVQYTERSDMYSFGVLLTELETCQLPYHDHQTRQDLPYDLSTTTTATNGDGQRRSSLVGGSASGGGAPMGTVCTLASTPVSRVSCATSDTPLPASLRPFLILNLVMNGSLRPSFSPTCPEWLKEIAASCFRGDPTKRPTAQHVVEVLERQWSMME